MRISFRQGPAATPLMTDYVENFARLQTFYANDYSLETIQRIARSRAPLAATHRARLCTALARQQAAWGAGQRGVEKLAAGAVAVVTGQQPMLFSGPHFSILKSITVIKIAAELEREGIPAVPVFWLASEDHDYMELESTAILGPDAQVTHVRVNLSNTDALPAGWMRFGDDVKQAVSQCVSQLPASEFTAEVDGLLSRSYEPNVSPVTAFARLMARLFEGTDLTLLDPLDEDVKALAQPTMDSAIRRNADLRSALIQRSRALSAAGYHEQVKVDENFTGMFAFRGRSRRPVRPSEVQPGISWSPNVLLRPVVQDTILPTAAYVAGPAEVAYFAQAGAAYEVLDVPMPPVFPRISATLVEPRIARSAAKYGIEFQDVFLGRDHLKGKAASAIQDDGAFERLRSQVEGELEAMRPVLNSVDSTLLGALETSKRKMLHQVDALRGRFVSTVVRRNAIVERHLDAITNSWYPEKKFQERLINIHYFLSRYGIGLLPRLTRELSLDTREHQIQEI